MIFISKHHLGLFLFDPPPVVIDSLHKRLNSLPSEFESLSSIGETVHQELTSDASCNGKKTANEDWNCLCDLCDEGRICHVMPNVELTGRGLES